jgi:hypothetical protein
VLPEVPVVGERPPVRPVVAQRGSPSPALARFGLGRGRK